MVTEQETLTESERLAEYERAVDTLVDIDNRLAELEAEVEELKRARIAVEMDAIARAIDIGIESDRVRNRLVFLRREMDIKVVNEAEAVALCERLGVSDGVEYSVSPSNALRVQKMAPELVDKHICIPAIREYVRRAKLPGARERVLAPFKGVLEVSEYTFMRTRRR